MFSHAVVDKGVTSAASYTAGRFLCWSRCPLAVIADYGRYLEMVFSVIPGHFAKDPSLISCIRVFFGWAAKDLIIKIF